MTPRDTFKRALAVLFAVLMMSSMATAAAPGLTRTSPAADSAVGWWGYDVPDDVVRYGQDTAYPGVFVTVDAREDLSSLEQWANASSKRTVERRYPASNTFLISAPMSDIALPAASVQRVLGVGGTVVSLGYVSGWSFDRGLSRSDPITNLETSESYETPAGAAWAKASGGEFSADSLAYSEDAPHATITDAARVVGADNVSATGEGVTVAVIDTGCQVGDGRVYGNGSANSTLRVADAYDFVESEPGKAANGYENVSDPVGHGSWVSSAVVGADGIAPDASLLCYRALNSDGSGSTSDIVSAISRADRHGADLIVMSLGSPVHSDMMARELQRVLSEDGNVTGVFVAAGNSYTTARWITSPADTDGVIAVSAAPAVNNSTARKAYFANVGPDSGLDKSGAGDLNTRGEVPDTMAPGMNVSTPTFSQNGGLANRTLSGTSMAAPIAAGVGALLLDAEPHLKGQPEEFRERVVNSGWHTPHVGLTESRGGMVNATRAIKGWDTDATERALSTETEGTDAGNRALSGDVGRKMAALSRWTDAAGGAIPGGITG